MQTFGVNEGSRRRRSSHSKCNILTCFNVKCMFRLSSWFSSNSAVRLSCIAQHESRRQTGNEPDSVRSRHIRKCAQQVVECVLVGACSGKMRHRGANDVSRSAQVSKRILANKFTANMLSSECSKIHSDISCEQKTTIRVLGP